VGLVAAGFVEGVKPSPEVEDTAGPMLWRRLRAALRRGRG